MERAKDSAYGRQLSDGFRALRFEQPLEAEFRAHFTQGNRAVQRFGAAQGLVATSLLALLDWRTLPPELVALPAGLRLAAVVPLLLALLLATYPGALARRRDTLATAAGLALAATAAILLLAAPAPLLQRYLLDANLATLFIYLMLGLRFYPAVCLALPLAAAGVWAAAGSEPTSAGYNGVFILLVNVIGAYSSHRLEHSARTIFLEKEIVSLLSGNDSATGIPNRRTFNAHLQNLRRQGARDVRSVALALIELEGMEDLAARHGRSAAARALRQVAHAVMRSARRPLDLAARFDESRFALLLYEPEAEYLPVVAKRIREAVARLELGPSDAARGARVVVRTGMGFSRPGGPHDAERLLAAAVEALAVGRREGRDGVVIVVVAEGHGERVTSGPWTAGREDADTPSRA
jgi:diguanylate cyclase (GGDEF)-like protein